MYIRCKRQAEIQWDTREHDSIKKIISHMIGTAVSHFIFHNFFLSFRSELLAHNRTSRLCFYEWTLISPRPALVSHKRHCSVSMYRKFKRHACTLITMTFFIYRLTLDLFSIRFFCFVVIWEWIENGFYFTWLGLVWPF